MVTQQRGVTVFVPALNEAENLAAALESVLTAGREAGDNPIEIIVVNDGSTDGTADIIRRFEKSHNCIRGIHHVANTGWGISFQEAIRAAKYEKLALYPGDGMISTKTLRDMIRSAYSADFVCSYSVNKEARTKLRNFISLIYTKIYVQSFGLPLRYVNATPVYPVSLVRSLHLRCKRYSFPAEVTVKVLRAGCSFMEIPGYYNPVNMTTSAFRFKNLLEVMKTYAQLLLDVYLLQRSMFAKRPVRVEAPSGEASCSHAPRQA